jgi:ABC-type multidrug transport system fused ATPase/permease subunit
MTQTELRARIGYVPQTAVLFSGTVADNIRYGRADATDARLRAALRQETANATVFVVAQRISTIVNADRIIVLDEGRVVGIGTHAELLQSSGVYLEIVASQVSLDEVA